MKVVEVRKKVSCFEEDKLTKEYMYRYGTHKVRGGSYVCKDLSDTQIRLLTTEIRMATNNLYICSLPS